MSFNCFHASPIAAMSKLRKSGGDVIPPPPPVAAPTLKGD